MAICLEDGPYHSYRRGPVVEIIRERDVGFNKLAALVLWIEVYITLVDHLYMNWIYITIEKMARLLCSCFVVY
jgi:hypothetical protein